LLKPSLHHQNAATDVAGVMALPTAAPLLTVAPVSLVYAAVHPSLFAYLVYSTSAAAAFAVVRSYFKNMKFSKQHYPKSIPVDAEVESAATVARATVPLAPEITRVATKAVLFSARYLEEHHTCPLLMQETHDKISAVALVASERTSAADMVV